ncbi:hypothetical protein GLYMA_06G139700v4 [Glycine max]|uniref:Uncharacterized protein n=1 Tax=Glycine max TaxID=3847 RepID=K7KUY7_SOYBN|nr:hypothetical protein GYH30_015048 [Glycine max]KRH53671.1 hypothetical protein GLYMA_06G139700v4 [Glycine max]
MGKDSQWLYCWPMCVNLIEITSGLSSTLAMAWCEVVKEVLESLSHHHLLDIVGLNLMHGRAKAAFTSTSLWAHKTVIEAG